MRVREAMKTAVVSCRLEAYLAEAAKLMVVHGHHCLPVLEDRLVVGVVTDRDLWGALEACPAALTSIQVGQVMSRDLAASRPDDPVESSLMLMRERQLRHLPVVSAEGALVGMLCLQDLVRALGPRADSSARRELAVTLALILRHRPRGAEGGRRWNRQR